MVKNFYQKELLISATQQQNGPQVRKDILKIQSWLVLYEMRHPGSATLTSIDGDFGPATDQAVKNFQKLNLLPVNGVVDEKVFSKLSDPLKQSFETPPTGRNLREMVVNTAIIHLSQHPVELMINKETNSGPWVRSYMDGHEGDAWFWCMGFVQAIIDQATSAFNKSYKTLMPPTYSCDTVGSFALTQHNLVSSAKLRHNPALIKPGDIFLIQKSPFDWIHTGIVVKAGTETIESIEGNTNSMGSRNGNAVFRRVRNFMKTKMDIVSLNPLL